MVQLEKEEVIDNNYRMNVKIFTTVDGVVETSQTIEGPLCLGLTHTCNRILDMLEDIAPREEWMKAFIKAYGTESSCKIKYEGEERKSTAPDDSDYSIGGDNDG